MSVQPTETEKMGRLLAIEEQTHDGDDNRC